METGQKIIQQRINIDELSSNILSIQVSLNGLSFCVLDIDKNVIDNYFSVDFDKKLNPQDLLLKIKAIYASEPILQESVKHVNVIYDNELSVLVPKPLFNEEYLADYLKFNTRILQTDFITFDTIQANESICVYVPYVNINNFFYENYGAFEYRHFSTVLIESIMSLEKNATETKMYVNVNPHHFEIIVIEKNELKLYNTFEYQTKEDFIYYILFTAEQLQLNPEDFKLVFTGQIKENDDLYSMTYTYVRHVSILEPITSHAISEDINADLMKNYILLNSL